MELSSFSENIVIEPFERNGEVVKLQINIDALVPDYYQQLEERLALVSQRLQGLQAKIEDLQKQIKRREKLSPTKLKLEPPAPSMLPIEKEVGEIHREIAAVKLTCPVGLPDGKTTTLLKGWDITEGGMTIAPTFENLMRLPPKLVIELWECAIARTTTVKKTVDSPTIQSQTTPETTTTGSPEFTLAFSGQVM